MFNRCFLQTYDLDSEMMPIYCNNIYLYVVRKTFDGKIYRLFWNQSVPQGLCVWRCKLDGLCNACKNNRFAKISRTNQKPLNSNGTVAALTLQLIYMNINMNIDTGFMLNWMKLGIGNAKINNKWQIRKYLGPILGK